MASNLMVIKLINSPSIINVSFADVGSDSLLIALRNQLAITSGSACNTGAIEASHVLRGMGIEGDRLLWCGAYQFGSLHH